MSQLAGRVYIESEYIDRFKQAVAFYDHGLIAEAGKEQKELVAKAIVKAELPIFGSPNDFYELIIVYHKTTSVFAENLLRYIWVQYAETHR